MGIVCGRSFSGNCLGKKFQWELFRGEVLVGIVWGSFSGNCLGRSFSGNCLGKKF